MDLIQSKDLRGAGKGKPQILLMQKDFKSQRPRYNKDKKNLILDEIVPLEGGVEGA